MASPVCMDGGLGPVLSKNPSSMVTQPLDADRSAALSCIPSHSKARSRRLPRLDRPRRDRPSQPVPPMTRLESSLSSSRE